MKKYNIIITFFFTIFFLYSLINIKDTNLSTTKVLLTFSKNILPSLLPFLILNQLIIKLGVIDLLSYILQFISYPLFKITGKGASIIIIGLLNGFPSSAIFSSILVKEKQITNIEAQRLTNNIFFPSISFLFVIINSNLNDNTLFTYLIISIYLSGFILLYISSFKITQKSDYLSFQQTIYNIKHKLKSFIFIKELKQIITHSFNTLINILGIIVIFAIPCNIIEKTIYANSSYFFKGLIEFSIPTLEILSLNINKKIIVLILSSILSFSGIASIMQASLFLNEANLSTPQFIKSRIIITIITTSILSLFLFLL